MATWIKFTLIGVAAAGAGAALALWIAAARWNQRSTQAVDSLLQAIPAPGAATTVDFAELDALPPPVARYFRYALTDGQPLIRSARIITAGEFNSSQGEPSWAPFQATQVYSAQPPGFVWDAAIRMAPLTDVRVRDAYAAGHGSMLGTMLGVIPVVDQRGAPELNAGALLRYLAEAVWLPTALLPSMGVQWTPLDDRSALATLTDAGTTVSLEFHFADDGSVARVYTPERPREVNGAYEEAAWEGAFWDYATRDGMKIPTQGAVEWQLPDKTLPYWRGRIVDAAYDFAP